MDGINIHYLDHYIQAGSTKYCVPNKATKFSETRFIQHIEQSHFFEKYCIFKHLSLLFSRKQIINPSHPNPRRREKINLNFYFHTSLWSLRRFYEGVKGFHKTF